MTKQRLHHSIKLIDDMIQNKARSTYRGEEDHRERVIAKPTEAYGLLKRKIRLYKAWKILTGEADAVRYDKYQ